MNSNVLSIAARLTLGRVTLVLSFSDISVVNMARKNLLLAARIHLWAENSLSSTINITSQAFPESLCVFSIVMVLLSWPCILREAELSSFLTSSIFFTSTNLCGRIKKLCLY